MKWNNYSVAIAVLGTLGLLACGLLELWPDLLKRYFPKFESPYFLPACFAVGMMPFVVIVLALLRAYLMKRAGREEDDE